jgi:virginiamycin A acetyltransferase
MTSESAMRFALTALQVALSPMLLGCWIESRWGAGEHWFGACAELLSLLPGWPGSMVRKAFYRATLRACASRAYISFGALIVHRTAAIGRNAYIGPYSIIGAASIGDDVKIASRASILSGRRQHDVGGDGRADAAPRLSEVSIGDGSWIGEGAIVMANVGRNSIVGAGSVVVRDVADGVTVVGNPAGEGRGPEQVRSRAAPVGSGQHEGARTWGR